MQPKRDGKLPTIWQQSVQIQQPKNSWSREARYDVLVIGGGITGLSTALTLQEQGLKCIVAEAHNVGFGTTGGTTAHLNTLLDSSYAEIERDFSAEASRLIREHCREAISTIESNINRYSIDCEFEYKDGFVLAQNVEEVEQLEKIRAGAERAGDDVQYVEDVAIPFPSEKILRFARQAQFHPLKYLKGLMIAYEAAGGVLLEHCVVSKIETDPDFVAITSLGSIKAAQVIYATHIPPGINILHFRCAPYRSYAMAFPSSTGVELPGLVYDLKDPYNYFRSQNIDGKEYIIAGGFDHKTGHEADTEQRFRDLEQFVRQYYDVGSKPVRWSSQYYQSADGLPYIGKLPGAEKGIWVATGFGGNGLIFGTMAASILSRLIADEDHPCADILKPSRIKPIAGFAAFVKENADVVSRMIDRKISYEQLGSLADLAPGQAMMADWEGHKVAMYKDQTGACHAVNPVCVHAGCTVSWNNAEESWDCPCHGARYSPKGDMLNGPAAGNLESVIHEPMDGD